MFAQHQNVTKDMTKGSPLKLILQFCIPLFLGMLFQQFYNMMDTVIVGKFLGHSHMKHQNQYKIKNNIQYRRQDQEKQRTFAVTQRPYDSGKKIVQINHRDAQKNHKYVIIGALHYIGRRIHPH